MYPSDKPGSPVGDPKIRIEESAISSMLAHYFQFEEALGMNVARGVVEPVQSSYHHPMVSQVVQGTEDTEYTEPEELPFPREPRRRIVAVIHAYNEELTIGSVVITARKHADEVLVVDNNSTDATAEIAEAAGALVIRSRRADNRNSLAGTAISYAKEHAADVLVMLGDTSQHPVHLIPALATPVREGDADIVIGSRCYTIRKSSPARIGNYVSLSTCSDPESPFWAISSRALQRLDERQDFQSLLQVAEAITQCDGNRVLEVPIISPGSLSTIRSPSVPLYRGKKIGVVVPAYNVEHLIGETLSTMPDYIARIYPVDDCSSDRTGDIIDAFARGNTFIVPIHHTVNRGVGAAIASGYRAALDDGMDIVAVMAGDNQMDPEFLSRILDPIIDGTCDYTVGNRLVSPEYRRGMSAWRFFGNSLLTLLTKIASGYWQLMDPQNGYTAISARALERIDLESLYPRYGYCNDLLVKLNVIGVRVKNVPHPARYGKEHSGIRYRTYILNVSHLLLKDFLWRLKTKYIILSFHPLAFFYLAGAILTPLGVAGGLITLWEKLVMGYPVLFVHGVLSFLMFMMGVQFLFFAMLFDMQANQG